MKQALPPRSNDWLALHRIAHVLPSMSGCVFYNKCIYSYSLAVSARVCDVFGPADRVAVLMGVMACSWHADKTIVIIIMSDPPRRRSHRLSNKRAVVPDDGIDSVAVTVAKLPKRRANSAKQVVVGELTACYDSYLVFGICVHKM